MHYSEIQQDDSPIELLSFKETYEVEVNNGMVECFRASPEGLRIKISSKFLINIIMDGLRE